MKGFVFKGAVNMIGKKNSRIFLSFHDVSRRSAGLFGKGFKDERGYREKSSIYLQTDLFLSREAILGTSFREDVSVLFVLSYFPMKF